MLIGSETQPDHALPKSMPVLVVEGIKERYALQTEMLGQTINAAENLMGKGTFSLTYREHPGEKRDAEAKGKLADYERERDARATMMRSVLQIRRPLTMSELVGFADITVTTGGPTDTIVGPSLRAGIIYVNDAANRQAVPDWFPAQPDVNALEVVDDNNGIQAALARLFTAKGADALLQRQAKHFPQLPYVLNDTAPRIIELIETIVRG
jgi:hypothetical protein